MTEPEVTSPTPARAERAPRSPELIIVILLGIASVATAYVSFQSALYDGMTASAYSQAQNAQTEAESLYLEANQAYIQDTQTWAQMTQLTVDMDSADPASAAAAEAKFDNLHFVMVDDVLDAAITWSNEQSATGEYVSPFDHEDYFDARFGGWAAENDRSDELFAQAELFNAYGDRLQLNTVLMAITLFLLGVAAVLRAARMQYVLIAFGGVIFLIAVVLSALVPFVWL